MKIGTWSQISIDTEGDRSLCFGCGQNNPIGLKLNFQPDGKTARAEFTPAELYQGWPGFVHGGIIICLLDEAMAYAALFQGKRCVTARMQARLRSLAPINEPLVITASVTRETRKLIETKATIALKDGTPIAEGVSTQFVVNSTAKATGAKTMPGRGTKAVIWDMDGVIADTAPYHFKAWQQVFRKRGVRFTREDFTPRFGQRNDTIIRSVLGEATPKSEIDTIAGEKENNFRSMVRRKIEPLPGAIELLGSLSEHGFKTALASSGPMENIHLLISSLGIGSCLDVIVSGHDVTESKPSPQIFLLAAQRLGVEPEDCVVIEDAVAGVAAARKAGMHSLAVTTTNPRESLTEADLIVDTLEAVTADDLDRLLVKGKKTGSKSVSEEGD